MVVVGGGCGNVRQYYSASNVQFKRCKGTYILILSDHGLELHRINYHLGVNIIINIKLLCVGIPERRARYL